MRFMLPSASILSFLSIGLVLHQTKSDAKYEAMTCDEETGVCTDEGSNAENDALKNNSLHAMLLSKKKSVDDFDFTTLFGELQVVNGNDAEKKDTQDIISKTVDYLLTLDKDTLEQCKNTHDLCSFWASFGECKKNPNFMLKGCGPACFSCSGRIDPQFEVSSEEKYDLRSAKYGEPQVIVDGRVRKLVQDTPAYLDSIEDSNIRNSCKNSDEKCSFWAVSGECEKNREYMKSSCAPACRTCQLANIDSSTCPILSEIENPAIFKRGEMHAMFTNIANGKHNHYKPYVLARPDVRISNERDSEEVIVGDGTPWVITFDSFLSDEECEKLIELGYDGGYEGSENGTFDGKELTLGSSESAWCDESCQKDPMVKSLMSRIQSITQVPEENSELLLISKFEQGQFYQVQHDFITQQTYRNSGPRVLTFIFFLNDVEEGGKTRFPSLDVTIAPKKGRAILWPNSLSDDCYKQEKMTSHEALPVTKGKKFTATARLHLKNYRAGYDKNCA